MSDESELDRWNVRAGEAFYVLRVDPQLWIHRRVESIRLGEEGRARRWVSFDLTVPDIPDLVYRPLMIPLTFIREGQLRSWGSPWMASRCRCLPARRTPATHP